MAGAFDNQISNRNFLSPVGFNFILAKEPKVSFFCNSARIPEISLGTAIQPSYLKDVDVPGDKLTYGGTQSGTIDHITVYLWAKAMGQSMPNYVPFGGGAELATQLVAGAVDVGTLNLSEASSQVEAGDVCPMVILDRNPMAPIPKAKTSIEMGIDLELATVRGYATHAGVDKARRDELEAGMMKAMNHSLYQAYLTNSGLDSTSPMGAEDWGKQMKMMVNEFGPALKEMGLVK